MRTPKSACLHTSVPPSPSNSSRLIVGDRTPVAITIRIVIAPPNTTAGTVPIRRAVTPLSKAPISFEEPEAKCGVGISGRGRQASHRHSLLARARPRICLASVRPRTELDRGSAAAPSRYVRQRIGNPTQEQTPHDEKSCDRHH